jgi:hypothetical protein
MTFLEGVELGSDARAFIPQLQRAGYSANGALEFLRAQGAGMRRATFLQTWGEVARDLASRPGIADIPQDVPMGVGDLATWRAGRPGTFGYQVNIALRDRATGLVTIKTHYVFSPENLAPTDVTRQAMADYLDAQTAGGPSGVAMAAYFVQGYQMLGRSG